MPTVRCASIGSSQATKARRGRRFSTAYIGVSDRHGRGEHMGQPIGRIESVNVGQPREVPWHHRVVTTATWKEPVTGRIAGAGVNLDGDDQADRRVHGGPTKSMYAY